MDLIIELESGSWFRDAYAEQDHVKAVVDFISEKRIRIKQRTPVNVGREKENVIVLDNNTVSRKHCIISPTTSGKWIVNDLDSKFGVYIQKTEEGSAFLHLARGSYQLKNGDVLCLGGTMLNIRLE